MRSLIALLMLSGFIGSAVAGSGPKVYEKARKASVEILVAGRQSGSGWFADREGHVVTAAHFLDKTTKDIVIMSPTLGRIKAELVALDRGHDIALLKAAPGKEPYEFLKVADKVSGPGETVYLFGSALFRHEVMVTGQMARSAATYEYLSDHGNYVYIYHISAPSPPGTSGGCWLNEKGEIIGNQSAFMSQGKNGMGIAMSSDIEGIRQLIKTKESPMVPTAGTAFEEFITQHVDFIKRFPEGSQGVVPVLTKKNGPADKAGLKGDMLITHFEGVPIDYRDTLVGLMYSKKPGDEVTFTVIHADKTESEEIKLKLDSH